MVRRENDGYCIIKDRIKPQQILNILENIPYHLLPPTLKKVEDFVKGIGIKKGFMSIPELRLNRSLIEFAKKNDMYPMIPYIEKFDKCDWGQSGIEMAKDLNIRELYLALEYAVDSVGVDLKRIENLLNAKGKELIEYKYPVYDSYDKDKIRYYNNEFSKLGSELYNNSTTDFDTRRIKRLEEEREERREIQKAFEYNSEEYNEISEQIKGFSKKREELRKQAKRTFQKNIHKFWINEWYDKNAWDFDEEERKELENPYIKKEE